MCFFIPFSEVNEDYKFSRRLSYLCKDVQVLLKINLAIHKVYFHLIGLFLLFNQNLKQMINNVFVIVGHVIDLANHLLTNFI